MTAEPRAVTLRWQKIYRIVASRHPPVNVFENILREPGSRQSAPGAFENIPPARRMELSWFIEGLTNDRLRDESGEAQVMPDSDRVRGPGASIVMAPFTHTGFPSRFSDGSYGCYYAARSLETAVRETAHHRGKFLAATNESPCEIDMRAYVGRPVQPFLDIRSPRFDRLHDPNDYAPSQAFAKPLREAGHWGLVYRSVRHEGGECIAAFKPQAVSIPIAGAALAYVWDGERITKVYEKSEVRFELSPTDQR